MNRSESSTHQLDHLGIVTGIGQAFGPDGRKVSVGQAVQAMVLNGLGFVNRTLYLTPEFYADKPVDADRTRDHRRGFE